MDGVHILHPMPVMGVRILIGKLEELEMDNG